MRIKLSQIQLGVLLLTCGSVVHAAVETEQQSAVDTVIVTGTRDVGRTARESATPIDVIRAEDLIATGQTNLLDALKDIVPSISTPAVGYDIGALARTFQLRGLSPGQTLVLINGKRRHLSASLYADSDPAQGSNAVDLDLIPLSAIDHVEILRDGAAAQYGSDAIAGVINVILKSSVSDTNVAIGGGGYVDVGGKTGQLDVDKGFAFGDGGTVHLSGTVRSHGSSNRSGDSGGPQPALVQGDPEVKLAALGYDLEQAINPNLKFYSFGTFAHRSAQAYENPRQPSTAGGYLDPAVDTIYPNGFSPLETVSENDFGLSAGIKGLTDSRWNWDLSATYGKDKSNLDNIHTINPDQLINFGNAQTSFHVGSFASSELTTNFDVRKPYAVASFATPLIVALGLEDRYENFQIGAGEPNSYYLGGSQAFPGFMPTDQIDANRNSVAAYIDLSTHVIPEWEWGIASREEHYNDVGNRLTGKLTTRYDFSPQFAVRSTISNGFHAPTLPQQYYSATTVTTGFAQIQVPLGSPGATVLGAQNLKPETSTNFSAGLVASPARTVHASIDVYQIKINDRIIQSASIPGTLAAAAIAANGSVIPSDVPAANASAAFFTNGVDTRTRGVDTNLDFVTDVDDLGFIRWVLTAGYNDTAITNVHAASAPLEAAGLSLVDVVQRSNLTTATPHTKISLSPTYVSDSWEVTLRETFYSNSSQVQGYAPGPYYTLNTGKAFITDLNVSYAFSKDLKFSIGANNLFNKYPEKQPAAVYQALNYDQYSHVSPFGINGGYYYARVSLAFK